MEPITEDFGAVGVIVHLPTGVDSYSFSMPIARFA